MTIDEKEAKEQKAKDDLCEKHDRILGVIDSWGRMCAKYPRLARPESLSAEEVKQLKMTMIELKVFIEMRLAEKPCAASVKSASACLETAISADVLPIPARLKPPTEPIGYAAWKEKQDAAPVAAAPAPVPVMPVVVPVQVMPVEHGATVPDLPFANVQPVLAMGQ